MSWCQIGRYGRGGLSVLLVGLAVSLLPLGAWAGVEEIREKALELEQKLQRHMFEVDARVKKPNTARIYKDFSFLLKDSKVNEVADAEGNDPRAGHLRLYLIEAMVKSELASFVDELRDFEQSGVAELDGEEVAVTDLFRKLAVTEEPAERLKLANLLRPFIETSGVFRGEIRKRRSELFSPWGFANYADFYAARENLDLNVVNELAQALLTDTEDLYNRLFDQVAQAHLGMEARKVRFHDMFFLAQGTAFSEAFPAEGRSRRIRSLFRGLGLPLEENLDPEYESRPGKLLRPKVFPIEVPGEIRVSLNPAERGVRDDDKAAFVVGEAMLFALSAQDGFEPAYLVNEPAQATLAWLPRLVLSEPEWIQATSQSEGFSMEEYRTFRAFLDLYEARFLAAQAQFEILAYRNPGDLGKDFRTIIRDALGVRVSTKDQDRAVEFLWQLRTASHFYGMLAAYGVRAHLRNTLGADWYRDGKSGSVLTGLARQGGNLTMEAIAQACPHQISTEAILASVRTLAGEVGGKR